jgi:hypothetical protein
MTVFLVLWCTAFPAHGQFKPLETETANKTQNEIKSTQEPEAKSIEEVEQRSVLERIERDKSRLETEGLRAAQWVDSFFSDPNYEAEVVTSQFRLRPEISYQSERGFDATLKASFKYSLPNLERKISLIGASFDTDTQVEDANEDTERESSIGVQFFANEREKWHSSFSVGIKDNDWAVTMGPRFRYKTDWGEKATFRYTQKILWQTNSEWQFKTNLNLDYVINSKFFFRQAVVARWRGEYADEEGTRTQLSSILTRRWKHDAGLQSEATVLFGTVPDTHVIKYLLAFRYRKRAWREWFYYEVVPHITWEERFDYDPNPGIRFRIEIFYGKGATSRYWSKRPEDRDGFHW